MLYDVMALVLNVVELTSVDDAKSIRGDWNRCTRTTADGCGPVVSLIDTGCELQFGDLGQVNGSCVATSHAERHESARRCSVYVV